MAAKKKLCSAEPKDCAPNCLTKLASMAAKREFADSIYRIITRGNSRAHHFITRGDSRALITE